jgi:hypothetical protein
MQPLEDPHHGEDEGFWTERRFRIAAIGGTAVGFLLLLWLRFDYEPTPPRMPTRPPAGPSAGELRKLSYSQGLFKAQLEKHASDTSSPLDMDAMTSPFAYESADVAQDLTDGAPPIETATLRLSMRTERMEVSTTQGRLSGDFIVLRIENKTDRHLAYRVETQAGNPQRCMTKGDIGHNAIALAPRETIERTECLWRSGMKLRILRVETLSIPRLSYFFVSRLYPPHIGLDNRPTRGHKPPKGNVCPDIPEQTIRRGMAEGKVTWRDVLDFYARHECGEYIFPPGYKAFEKKDQYQLPVSREAASQ